jgi:hypothetical protein
VDNLAQLRLLLQTGRGAIVRIEGRKRFGLIAATVAAVLVGGGVAVAFWTTTGDGTGTADVGTAGTVTITQDGPAITDLFPSDDVADAQDINFTINNGNAGPLRVSTVTISIASITGGGTDGTKPVCTAADFILEPSGGVVTIDADVAPGSTPYPSGVTGATIRMDNTALNQDNCQGATVNLAFDTP